MHKWVRIFGSNASLNKVHFLGNYFFPQHDLHPVIHENQNQYYFYQNGRIISEIPPQNVDDIAILEIYDRGTYNT